VAEKLSALQTDSFFTARAQAGNRKDFASFLDGAGHEPPADGDQPP